MIRNRGFINQKLLQVEKYLSSIVIESIIPSLSDVELRYKNSILLLEEFDKVQSMIESLCLEEDLEAHYKERESFENKYSQDSFGQILNKHYKVPSGQEESQFDGNGPVGIGLAIPKNDESLQNVLLPKLKLPTFSGSYEQWLNCKVNFTSINTNNASLTDY